MFGISFPLTHEATDPIDVIVIGIIPGNHKEAVVEEFFQLFKTPWEWFQDGRSYDVVLASADELPEIKAKLLVVFGAQARRDDAQRSIAAGARRDGAFVQHRGVRVPIYRGVLVFNESAAGPCCLQTDSGPAGIKVESRDGTILRVGYDLFAEVKWLLSSGQPIENAHTPSIEMHIAILRDWMLEAGVTYLEIPPVPATKRFIVCLTHDIDFIGIRQHKFDHTMWGFLYRSTLGALRDFGRRRISFGRLVENWQAAASLPFAFLGWVKDFWEPFDWYLRVERELPSSYFIIPFKNRAGERVSAAHAGRRATKYDITDLSELTKRLLDEGCELGVHGIDAWHSVDQGRAELARIASVTGATEVGVRTHWLLRDENSSRVLDEAGYAYDSTDGYNETIGYRSGTTQVFRPPGARQLLELPMHIQDGALFLPHRLGLFESEAWVRCGEMIDNTEKFGGVLTILWHDRSHAPERLWGDFYVRFVERLRAQNVWFGTAGQVVAWFRKRRQVVFERTRCDDGKDRVKVRLDGESITPPLILRTHGVKGHASADVPWNGGNELQNTLVC